MIGYESLVSCCSRWSRRDDDDWDFPGTTRRVEVVVAAFCFLFLSFLIDKALVLLLLALLRLLGLESEVGKSLSDNATMPRRDDDDEDDREDLALTLSW